MTASYNLCLKRKHQIFTVRIVSSYTSEFSDSWFCRAEYSTRLRNLSVQHMFVCYVL